jgi:hypothetical protein
MLADVDGDALLSLAAALLAVIESAHEGKC